MTKRPGRIIKPTTINDLPEIEEIHDDPSYKVLEYLRENKMITIPIIRALLKDMGRRSEYVLEKMTREGLLISEKKLVRMKGDTQFRMMNVWKVRINTK